MMDLDEINLKIKKTFKIKNNKIISDYGFYKHIYLNTNLVLKSFF